MKQLLRHALDRMCRQYEQTGWEMGSREDAICRLVESLSKVVDALPDYPEVKSEDVHRNARVRGTPQRLGYEYDIVIGCQVPGQSYIDAQLVVEVDAFPRDGSKSRHDMVFSGILNRHLRMLGNIRQESVVTAMVVFDEARHLEGWQVFLSEHRDQEAPKAHVFTMNVTDGACWVEKF